MNNRCRISDEVIHVVRSGTEGGHISNASHPLTLPLVWLVQNHQDWPTVVTALETGLEALVRIGWPLPFHPPEVHESLSYASSPAPARRIPLMPEALYPSYAPTLFVKGLGPGGNSWLVHAVAALRHRWQTEQKQREETFVNLLNEMGIHLYLAQSRPEDIFAALVYYAQRLTQAPVVYTAVRRKSDIIETVSNRGISNPGFGFHLKVGRGVGGTVSKTHESVVIPDYRRSAMRDATVTRMIDDEGILSGAIVPWAMPTGLEGVLYVTHRQAYPVSPTDALLLERFVGGIKDVYQSSEKAKSQHPRSSRFVFLPEDLQLAERLKNVRNTLSWSVFRDTVEALGIRTDITDMWNLSVFPERGELPPRPPNFEASIGCFPYEGTFRVWHKTETPSFSRLWPAIRETASWLLSENQSQEWDQVYRRSSWIPGIRGRTSERQPGRDEQEPQLWDELVGMKRTGSNTEWSRSDTLSVQKLVTGACAGAEVYWDGSFLWLVVRGQKPCETWPRLRQEISRLSAAELIMMSLSRQSGQSVRQALDHMRVKMLEWTRTHSDGTYRTLDSYQLADLLISVDKTSREQFMEHWIGPLVRGQGSQGLIDTLYTYLSTGSVQKTASALFLHQNTVRYRLRKTCEILGLASLEKTSDRENLWLASRLWMMAQHPK